MFVRVCKGQKQAVAIGSDNLYPGYAGEAGNWVRVDDKAKAVVDKLVAAKRVEVYTKDDTPINQTQTLSKSERELRQEEYKAIIQTEHWSKIAARIKNEKDETAVQDWLVAAKALDRDEDTGVMKVIRQRLDEMRK